MNTGEKEFLFGLVAVGIGVLIAVLSAEVLLHIFLPGEKVPFVYDETLGFRAIPGGEYDERGFRNESGVTDADIVVFGDSQTMGYNARPDEAWPQILERQTEMKVYQMALVERGVPQHFALLDEALMLSPQTIMVGFYLGNDLLDATRIVYSSDFFSEFRRDTLTIATDGAVARDVRTSLESGFAPGSLQHLFYEARLFIRNNSKLYKLIGNGTRQLREKVGLAESVEEKKERARRLLRENPTLGTVIDTPGIETILSPSYRLQTVNLDNPDTAEGWRLTKLFLEHMQERAKQANIRFSIIIIPTKELVYLEWFAKQGTLPPQSFLDYEAKERALLSEIETWCRGAFVECFSTLPALSDALSEGIRVYPDSEDGHPTALGYERIATFVARNVFGDR